MRKFKHYVGTEITAGLKSSNRFKHLPSGARLETDSLRVRFNSRRVRTYLRSNLLAKRNREEFDRHNKFQISLFEEEVASCQLRSGFPITSPYYW